ncbi:PhzF family phenazine biosynthesis protein [Rhodobacteraceae bacterium 63075]|nr:PhzF family phenazine biosynthesis protein [Rhodobacteraceae bacterium 63075]
MTDYLVYDVFTAAPFGGNQLAIIPDASALPEEQLQKIAREFNFSETSFVYTPQDAAHTARLRIFTPTMEVPFAGHPTIGTAIALADLGHGPEMTLELGIGPIATRAEGGSAAFTTHVPLEILARPEPGLIARALGIAPDDICMEAHPPTMAGVGLPFTLTRLKSRAALARCTPQTDAFREGNARYPGSLDFAQFVYTDEGDTLHARMFAPLDDIPEDPATGSAAAALGAFLAQLGGKDISTRIIQGADMGRPSVIGLEASQGRVSISGQACRTMQGRLTI